MNKSKIEISDACCSYHCDKFDDCARAYKNNVGYCVLHDYENTASAFAYHGADGLREACVRYRCGENGNYRMFTSREESGSNKGR